MGRAMEPTLQPKRTFQTAKGRTVDAELVISATGSGPPNTEFIRRAWPDALEPSGKIAVQSDLRVVGKRNVFAMGDAASADPRQSIVVIKAQIEVIRQNIMRLMADPNKDIKLLKTFFPPPNLILVTLGRGDGVLDTPWFTLKGLIPTLFKSRDMAVSNIRRQLGLETGSSYGMWMLALLVVGIITVTLYIKGGMH